MKKSRNRWVGLLAFGGAVAGAAALGGLFNPGRDDTRDWFRELEKPPFNPPDAVFGPVWTVLYVLMAMSAYRVWRTETNDARTRALVLWSVQLALNAAWSPIFFGAKKPALAFADIALLLPSIALYTRESARVDRTAAWLMAPYLGWVTFAAALNEEIARRN